MGDLKGYNSSGTTIYSPRKMLKAYTVPRNHRSSTDFITPNNHVFELDSGSYFPTSLTKWSDSCTETKSSASLHKSLNKLPERLNFLKQLVDNKNKFRRVEKEINELKLCTFHPKINTPATKNSLAHFSKQQEEYKKSRNSKLLQLNLQYATTCSNNRIKPRFIKGSTLSNVHEKLYLQSRVFSKITAFVKHYS